MREPKIARQSTRVIMAAQFPLDRAIEIDNVAKELGMSRHRLLVLAINAGIPPVVAAQAGKAAAQQQQSQG